MDDQQSFQHDGQLHHVALGDAAGTEVYVAEATGEIVMKTDRSSRFWGYLGPVMHWFYFTPLRAGRAPLWNNLIVYGSVVGCLVCVLGLAIGFYRFSDDAVGSSAARPPRRTWAGCSGITTPACSSASSR